MHRMTLMARMRSRIYLYRSKTLLGLSLSGPATCSAMHTSTQDCQIFRRDQYPLPVSASQRSTIYALATPPGRGGIGVVRISGPNANKVWKHMLVSPKRGKSIDLPEKDSPRRLFRCRIVHPVTGEVIDDGMAVYFHGEEWSCKFLDSKLKHLAFNIIKRPIHIPPKTSSNYTYILGELLQLLSFPPSLNCHPVLFVLPNLASLLGELSKVAVLI